MGNLDIDNSPLADYDSHMDIKVVDGNVSEETVDRRAFWERMVMEVFRLSTPADVALVNTAAICADAALAEWDARWKGVK